MPRWYPQIRVLELKEAEEWPQRQGTILHQVELITKYVSIIVIIYLQAVQAEN